jgi:hypothetical protein
MTCVPPSKTTVRRWPEETYGTRKTKKREELDSLGRVDIEGDGPLTLDPSGRITEQPDPLLTMISCHPL